MVQNPKGVRCKIVSQCAIGMGTTLTGLVRLACGNFVVFGRRIKGRPAFPAKRGCHPLCRALDVAKG